MTTITEYNRNCLSVREETKYWLPRYVRVPEDERIAKRKRQEVCTACFNPGSPAAGGPESTEQTLENGGIQECMYGYAWTFTTSIQCFVVLGQQRCQHAGSVRLLGPPVGCHRIIGSGWPEPGSGVDALLGMT